MVHQSSTLPDLTGTFVEDGRMLLIKILGSGSFGMVYRAMDMSTPKPEYFAVKCMRKFDSTSEHYDLQRREIMLHQRASAHPNVVTFHRTFEESGLLFIILDLCGTNLFDLLVKYNPFVGRAELFKPAFVELLDAVQHIHNQGVFHRDLKPENILCSQDGSNFRLADFGLATPERGSSQFGCGSLSYMSPECIGETRRLPVYSTRTNDVWGLAIIFINMLTGLNPWKYAKSSDDAYMCFLEDRDSLFFNLPISGECNDLLKRALDPNPLYRITIGEFRETVLGMGDFYRTEEEEAMIAEAIASEQTVFSRDITVTACGITAHLIVQGSSSSSSSSEDSDGPITPETRPAAGEEKTLALDALYLDGSVEVVPLTEGPKPVNTMTAGVFRGALRRMRGY